MVKPELTFKVKPHTKEIFYYKVKVFTNSAHMQKYIEQETKEDCPSDVRGMCRTWAVYNFDGKDSDGVLTGESGEILLSKDWLQPVVIAHEVTHAMFNLMRLLKKNIDPDDDDGHWVTKDEEWLCDCVGDMTAKIYKKLFDKGFC